ncbi:hypothetical protein N9L68_00735 [bacterium]|nr:hypothetical protein [bacterium]
MEDNWKASTFEHCYIFRVQRLCIICTFNALEDINIYIFAAMDVQPRQLDTLKTNASEYFRNAIYLPFHLEGEIYTFNNFNNLT